MGGWGAVQFIKGPAVAANSAGRPGVAVYMAGGMYGLPNVARTMRRLTRLADHMYRLPRKRRVHSKGATKPVGPRLVRGRGRPRNRPLSRLGGLVFYLVLAAGLTIVLFKYFVAPFVAG